VIELKGPYYDLEELHAWLCHAGGPCPDDGLDPAAPPCTANRERERELLLTEDGRVTTELAKMPRDVRLVYQRTLEKVDEALALAKARAQ
jgi:hypothetical protein